MVITVNNNGCNSTIQPNPKLMKSIIVLGDSTELHLLYGANQNFITRYVNRLVVVWWAHIPAYFLSPRRMSIWLVREWHALHDSCCFCHSSCKSIAFCSCLRWLSVGSFPSCSFLLLILLWNWKYQTNHKLTTIFFPPILRIWFQNCGETIWEFDSYH